MFALCKPSVTVRVPLLVVPEARRLNLRRIDVGEIDRIVAGHSGNGACEGRRVVELECTGVGGTTEPNIQITTRLAKTSLSQRQISTVERVRRFLPAIFR
jgi:hypothetical protein